MSTYIWRGGAYLWTAEYSFFAPENSQGNFIYYPGPPGPGDVVFLSSQPTIDGVSIVGETINIGAFTQDLIEDSSFDSTTIITDLGAAGAWNTDVYGDLDTGATMNIGNAGTAGWAAFLLAQTNGGPLPVINNSGTINLDNGTMILSDGGASTSEVAGQFVNLNQINIQYTAGSQGSGLSDQLLGGSEGFVNDGTIAINGEGASSPLDAYGFFSSNIGGIGEFQLTDARLVMQQGVSSGQTITFEDASSFMMLGTSDIPAGTFEGTIEGFRPGDTIDLGTAATNIDPSELGVIFINEGVNRVGSIDISAAPGNNTWALDQSNVDGDGLLEMTASTVACYAAGTRIRTPEGDVAVEHFRVGDHLLAHDGDGRMAPCSIVWIGQRAVDCRRHPAPRSVWPVRVATGAFGPGRPARDLFLSPDHAVFVDGALIPIRCLINGATIAQTPVPRVTYFHVELARHAVLLAEGLPAESFLDTGNRAAFANGGPAAHLHPDFSLRLWDGDACAPLVVAGPGLDRVRAMLNGRGSRRPPAITPMIVDVSARCRDRPSLPPRRRQRSS